MKNACGKETILKCAKCDGVVSMLGCPEEIAKQAELMCCGEPMAVLEEKTADFKTEKHVPVVTPLATGGIKVTVGSVPHPMTDEHYIVFIEVVNGSYVNRKYLKPGDPPEAEFYVPYSDSLIVREYCNIHGLWKK